MKAFLQSQLREEKNQTTWFTLKIWKLKRMNSERWVLFRNQRQFISTTADNTPSSTWRNKLRPSVTTNLNYLMWGMGSSAKTSLIESKSLELTKIQRLCRMRSSLNFLRRKLKNYSMTSWSLEVQHTWSSNHGKK